MGRIYKKAKIAVIMTFMTIFILLGLIAYFKITDNALRFMLYLFIYFLVINIRLYISKLLYELNCNYKPTNSYFKNLLKTGGTRPDCDAMKYFDSLIIKEQWKFILTISSILFIDLATLKSK